MAGLRRRGCWKRTHNGKSEEIRVRDIRNQIVHHFKGAGFYSEEKQKLVKSSKQETELLNFFFFQGITLATELKIVKLEGGRE